MKETLHGVLEVTERSSRVGSDLLIAHRTRLGAELEQELPAAMSTKMGNR